eukprot:1219735-Pyramimonas_sp.AAC.1
MDRLISDAHTWEIPAVISCFSSVSDAVSCRFPALDLDCLVSHMCRYKGCARFGVSTFIMHVMSDDTSRLGLRCPGARARDGHKKHVAVPRASELVPKRFQSLHCFIGPSGPLPYGVRTASGLGI